MRFNVLAVLSSAAISITSLHATTTASEFDLYLKDKSILNEQYKIQDKKQLDEILTVLSAEDSRTLPLQIDQNTLIEQLQLSHNQTELKGTITTPDFNQLETDLGKKEIRAMITQNLLNNCAIFFEHQYQRVNPYRIQVSLASDHDQYNVTIKQKDCGL